MASAAAPTANLLQTCAALLMSPYCGMHSPNIEAVLVKIGLQSTRIGLKLIDILLRNCAASGTDPASESPQPLPVRDRVHGRKRVSAAMGQSFIQLIEMQSVRVICSDLQVS